MTTYSLVVRFHASGSEHRYEFDSSTERALMLITLGPYVDVLEEGSELRDEPAEQTPEPIDFTT